MDKVAAHPTNPPITTTKAHNKKLDGRKQIPTIIKTMAAVIRQA